MDIQVVRLEALGGGLLVIGPCILHKVIISIHLDSASDFFRIVRSPPWLRFQRTSEQLLYFLLLLCLKDIGRIRQYLRHHRVI